MNDEERQTRELRIRDPKRLRMAKVPKNIRANNSEHIEGTTRENVGFEANGPESSMTSPRTLPWNFIAILSAPPKE